MEHEPTWEPGLRELMEAYRSDQDDGTQPEMAELVQKLAASPQARALYDRMRLFDAAVSAAFRDVPVPAGLSSRILARLAVERASAEVEAGEKTSASASPESRRASAQPRPVARRRWLYAAAVLAATAVGLLWIVFALFPRGESTSKTELMAAAIERFLNEPADPGQLAAAASSRYPLSQSLLDLASGRIAVIRWRAVNDFFGSEADAFDLIGPEGRVATVYAGRFSVEGLSAEVPQRPMLSTAETSASVWRENDVVYVLVVAGGDRAYERLVGMGLGPLA